MAETACWALHESCRKHGISVSAEKIRRAILVNFNRKKLPNMISILYAHMEHGSPKEEYQDEKYYFEVKPEKTAARQDVLQARICPDEPGCVGNVQGRLCARKLQPEGQAGHFTRLWGTAMSELRSKISQKILKLSEIQKPPHDTTILIRANVAKIASDIKKDVPVEPVIVAHLKGKYYPVGRLDILAAYKQSGVESLCCDIIQADSMRDILEAHIRSSRRGPINPISMIDVVSQIKEEADPDMEFIPLEYRKFDRLELGDSICKKFNNFVTELGERFEILPTITPPFGAHIKAGGKGPGRGAGRDNQLFDDRKGVLSPRLEIAKKAAGPVFPHGRRRENNR